MILKNIHKWNNSYKTVTILWSDVLQSRGDLKLTEKQRHTFYLSFLFFCAIFLSKKRCSKKSNFLSFTGTKMTRSFMYTNMHSQHGCSKRTWTKKHKLKKVCQRKWDFTLSMQMICIINNGQKGLRKVCLWWAHVTN